MAVGKGSMDRASRAVKTQEIKTTKTKKTPKDKMVKMQDASSGRSSFCRVGDELPIYFL